MNTASEIETWALNNVREAAAVGKFLYEAYQNPKTAVMPDDFNEKQKTVVNWAANNRFSAVMLFTRLAPKISAACNQ